MLPSIHLWGNFTLYTYPFLVGIAIGLAIFLLDQLQIKLDKWKIIILPIMWIGAKLAFILTAGSQYYQYLGSSDFWLGGGLVFYGAFISLSIYLFILWKTQKINLKDVSALFLAITFSHAVGRVGCFLAGCCYGININNWRIPIQLIEAFLLTILGLKLFQLFNQGKYNKVIVSYIGSYAILRFILEFFRDDSIRGNIGILTSSQLIALLLMASIVIYTIMTRVQCK